MVLDSLTGTACPQFENDDPVIKVTNIQGDNAIERFGDWIVKEPKVGFYYPVKDEVFKRGYIQGQA